MSGVSRETTAAGNTAAPWLTVVGVGDDGEASLTAPAIAIIRTASMVIGGQRSLDHLPADCPAQRVGWTTLDQTLDTILARRGQPTVVLATGDPMWFGLGSTLSQALQQAGHDPQREMAVLPTPGAFSLAAARLCWPLQDCLCLTAHGRPVAALRLHFAPGQRLLVLSRDGQTAAQVAAELCDCGYGPSQITALWHLGGINEGRFSARADHFSANPGSEDQTIPALNTLAIDCVLAEGARPLSRTPGLPDEAFEHDGQLTKREARALTLMALAPWPGAHLWDIGAGSGSIAIEWMRAAPRTTALAVERDPLRLARVVRNAQALGVPTLRTMLADLPAGLLALDDEQQPDVIFVGGGVSRPGLLDKLWSRLPAGGRLVTNAVTLEAEQVVLDFHRRHGGELRRLAVSRTQPVGRLTRWDTLAPLTQLCAEKP